MPCAILAPVLHAIDDIPCPCCRRMLLRFIKHVGTTDRYACDGCSRPVWHATDGTGGCAHGVIGYPTVPCARESSKTGNGKAHDESVDVPLFWQVRPKTVADCRNQPRPCPWVGCEFHLFLSTEREARTNGYNDKELPPIQYHFPFDADGAPNFATMRETCVLDPIKNGEGGGLTLEEVGDLYGLTRERMRQVESIALVKLRKNPTVRRLFR